MGYAGSSGGASYLTGLDTVMKNLNREIEGIKTRSVKGLIEAAAFIRYETENSYPLTPLRLGNLTASWFVVSASAVHSGGQSPQFQGPDASKFTSSHSSVLAETRATAMAKTTAHQKFVIMGYSVNYSGWIHEMIGVKNLSRAGSDIKWLEQHLYKNTKKIVAIVQLNARVK